MKKRSWLILIGALLLLAAAGTSAGVQLENRDAFCASCHTEPETTYYQRSLELPSDLASSHAFLDTAEVRCIDCHSGIGVAGRAGSLAQGAWDLLRYLSGSYQQPAVSSNPIGDAACLKCHTPPNGQPATDFAVPFDSSQHYHFAHYLAEWAARDPDPVGTCAFCHLAHTEGTVPEMHFTPPVASNDGCNDCHRALSGWNPND
jgi:nitrate/TMAO reductase-like tetraheme cytochrome c subunit